MRRIVSAAAGLALVAAVLAPGLVLAAPPANDNVDAAAPIDSLPFSAVVDMTEASVEPGEPAPCGQSVTRSAWFTLETTTGGFIRGRAFGPTFTAWNVYEVTGPGFDGLSLVGCSHFGEPMTVALRAATRYAFQVAAIFDETFVGAIELQVEAVPAPANDDFADAQEISVLPFSTTVDATASRFEPDETFASCGGQIGTVWYRYTPSQDQTLLVGLGYPAFVGVFTGPSLTDLVEVDCWWYFDWPRALRVTAGETYYFQLAGDYGPLSFGLELAPAPDVSFDPWPFDPSMYDTVGFNPWVSDPAGIGGLVYAWDFGDGTTSTDPQPAHRYGADGDYQVSLTVTTGDGRTASTTRTVSVRTRDVAIAKFLVPQSARAGQTRQITVGISNRTYPQTVQVELYRVEPSGGLALVGATTQTIPVRGANRTTDVSFLYTFTDADAAIGKATLRAVATIVDGRDALPGDNEAIATTRVSR